MEDYFSAVSDFKRARMRAGLGEILARITGRSTELLSYEEVRRQLRASGVASRQIVEIPLKDIVGSVNRYRDFTRDFLPRLDGDEDRWARVQLASSGLSGLPPVDLYQIGDAYFVNDGHHRISVAREAGAEFVQAYVTEIRSRVPLDSEIQPDELIIKAEYVDFLEATELDKHRPAADFTVTRTGQYRVLLEHIAVHRYYMGMEEEREVPFSEAVIHWYDEVYEPVIQVIHNLGILRHFPGRTETDLYLWIGKHRAQVESELAWEVPYSMVASDLAEHHATTWSQVASRIGKRILDIVVPDDFEPGPSFGAWRREQQASPQEDRLFSDILLALSGRESGWTAFEKAIEIATWESSNIHALHIDSQDAGSDGDRIAALERAYQERLLASGIDGTFTVDKEPIAQAICSRARWTDLVVAGLAHPPGDSPLSRVNSGFRRLLLVCSRPVLAVPQGTGKITRPMLAYDDSPKAREALYIAAYVASRWKHPLVVLSIEESSPDAEQNLDSARRYLEHCEVDAEYVRQVGDVSEGILVAIETHGCDWLIMGGYGAPPVRQAILGSVVDKVLSARRVPVLICR